MLFYSILGTLFTWGMTAAGAALVFVIPSALKYRVLQQKLLDGSLGFAGGVMLAASYFSLLGPALEMAEPAYGETWRFLPAVIGFLLGGAFVYAGDKFGPVDAMSDYLCVDKKDDGDDSESDALPSSVQQGVRQCIRVLVVPACTALSVQAPG
jgi:zinc transporter 11